MRLIAYILAGFILAQPAWAQGRGRARMLEEEIIQGKVQKPNIEIIIARQNLAEADQLVLKESFVPLILNSVETGPF
jgi:hypothetical protein